MGNSIAKFLEDTNNDIKNHHHTGKTSDHHEPLAVWGFDPILFDEKSMEASDLDQISTTRPIFVFHVSDHLATVNSALMKKMNITKETDVVGVVKGPDGNPTLSINAC